MIYNKFVPMYVLFVASTISLENSAVLQIYSAKFESVKKLNCKNVNLPF